MTGVAPTTVKIGVIGFGYVVQPNAVGFTELDITDIETGNDRYEARDAGAQIYRGTIDLSKPNVGPRIQVDTGVFHEA